jgi:hypothetical protein
LGDEGGTLSHSDENTSVKELEREDRLLGSREADSIVQVMADLLKGSVTD